MKSRLIAVGLYGVAALAALVVVGAIAVRFSGTNSDAPQPAHSAPAANSAQFALVQNGASLERGPSLPGEHPELDRLRAVLEQKDARLQETTAQLAQLSQRYDSVRREYEDSLQIAAAMLSHELADDATAAAGAETLRSATSGAASAVPVSETELLRWELEQARTQLADVQQQLQSSSEMQLLAEQELAALIADHEALRRTVADSLARLGASAAPLLVDLLDSTNAPTRKWAAEMLGDIGPAARDAAAPSLRLAISDRDPAVRAAAERALERIVGAAGN